MRRSTDIMRTRRAPPPPAGIFTTKQVIFLMTTATLTSTIHGGAETNKINSRQQQKQQQQQQQESTSKNLFWKRDPQYIKSNSLSMRRDIYESILSGEIPNEMDHQTLSDQDLWWDVMMEFDWDMAFQRARQAQQQQQEQEQPRQRQKDEIWMRRKGGGRQLFLACHGEEGKTGYRRMQEMEQIFYSSPEEEEIPKRRGGEVVSNSMDQTCCMMRLNVHRAQTVADKQTNHISVLPVGPLVKLRSGLVDAISHGTRSVGQRNDDGEEHRLELHVGLCVDDPQEDTARVVWRDVLQSLKPFHSTSGSKESEIEELKQKRDNQRRENPNGRQRKLHSSPYPRTQVSDAFFWTGMLHSISSPSHDTSSLEKEPYNTTTDPHSSRHLQLQHQMSQNPRALMWSQALQNAASPRCQTMYHQTTFLTSNHDSTSTPTHERFNIKFPPYHQNDTPCILSLVAALAVHESVGTISHLPSIALADAHAQWILQSNQVEKRPWFDVGLKGQGQVVSVVDNGLDTNHCYFHGEEAADELDLFVGKVNMNKKVVQYHNYSDYFAGTNSHGTHVAGTIVGRKLGDANDATLEKGMCPEAKVAFMDFSDDTDVYQTKCCQLPGDLFDLFARTNSTGSRIINASWSSKNASYTNLDAMIDKTLHEHPDFMFVVASGNHGRNGEMSLGSPSGAKNAITVGATRNAWLEIQRPDMAAQDYLSDFSSLGPTQDGRIKPDVVAPGHHILSARSLAFTRGECDPADGSLPELGGFKDGLIYLFGSSMATPVVSGACALIRQYFMEGWYPTGIKGQGDAFVPSGALVKAVLVTGGQPLRGILQENGGVVPSSMYDSKQGFGRTCLANSLPLAGVNAFNVTVFDQVVIEDGESWQETLKIGTNLGEVGSVSCEATHLTVSLVWMDPPAAVGCLNCVLNDLDLVVEKIHTANGQTSEIYFPNGQSGPDRKNNVERVRVDANDGDKFLVTVNATNLSEISQKFSLVAAGCLDFGKEIPTNAPTTSTTSPPLIAPPIEMFSQNGEWMEHTLPKPRDDKRGDRKKGRTPKRRKRKKITNSRRPKRRKRPKRPRNRSKRPKMAKRHKRRSRGKNSRL